MGDECHRHCGENMKNKVWSSHRGEDKMMVCFCTPGSISLQYRKYFDDGRRIFFILCDKYDFGSMSNRLNVLVFFPV